MEALISPCIDEFVCLAEVGPVKLSCKMLVLFRRLSAPASEDGSWWAGAQADSYDCVVVEAQCVASVSATLRACQSGDASPWPSPAEAALIAREANMVMAGFKASLKASLNNQPVITFQMK